MTKNASLLCSGWPTDMEGGRVYVVIIDEPLECNFPIVSWRWFLAHIGVIRQGLVSRVMLTT